MRAIVITYLIFWVISRMAGKKNKQEQKTEVSTKKVQPKPHAPSSLEHWLETEDLAKARAWLEGLNADIAYSQAKRQLAEACGWERSKSNAVIVALHEEGFMAGEKNYFCNPNAPAEPGVVRGAREVSNFTIMLQSDPEVSVPLPYAIHCLPGDVFMLRKTVTGNWRVSNFIARHQTRWVCKLVSATCGTWLTCTPTTYATSPTRALRPWKPFTTRSVLPT